MEVPAFRAGVDDPSHVLQVAGATIALGEVRLETDTLVLWQRPREVVGDQLDELTADECIVVV